MISWIWAGLMGLSLFCGIFTDSTRALSAAILTGAQGAVSTSIAMAGGLCLWCGIGRLMEASFLGDFLSRLTNGLLSALFPEARENRGLAQSLSGNFCANLLGLGNAATPLGIKAAQKLARGPVATDSLCRLVVMNTASIQLIPATVGALRAGLGCQTPFDILPAVWLTSFLSVSAGLCAAYFGGMLWKS